MAYALLDEIKIIDFRWSWTSMATNTVGYSSDSWLL